MNGLYLKKVTSPVKQNGDTVTVKYTYYCDCQAVPDNHTDSSKQIVGQHAIPA